MVQCHASQKGSKDSFYRLLNLPPNSSRAEIRAAYISKIRTMHPDISTDEDATSDAVALNAAYAALMVSSLLHDAARRAFCLVDCKLSACVLLSD